MTVPFQTSVLKIAQLRAQLRLQCITSDDGVCSPRIDGDEATVFDRKFRSLMSFSHVNQKWRRFWLPFVWKRVTITSIDSMESFLLLLTSEDGEIRHAVEDLRLDLPLSVVRQQDYRTWMNQTLSILAMCPNISALNWSSALSFHPHLSTLRRYLRISRVACGENVESTLGILFGFSDNLTAFSIHASLLEDKSHVVPFADTLAFPKLRHVHLMFCKRDTSSSIDICVHWSIPSLSSLAVEAMDISPTKLPSLASRFCTSHCNVQKLVILPRGWMSYKASVDIDPLLKILASLTHVIVHPRTHNFHHSSIEYVDVWSPFEYSETTAFQPLRLRTDTDFADMELPRLKGVCRLDPELYSRYELFLDVVKPSVHNMTMVEKHGLASCLSYLYLPIDYL